MPDTHPCPATSCPRQLPQHLLMCPAHWSRVPRELQEKVNHLWRNGPLSQYIQARQEAIDHVNALLSCQQSVLFQDPMSEGPYGEGA